MAASRSHCRVSLKLQSMQNCPEHVCALHTYTAQRLLHRHVGSMWGNRKAARKSAKQKRITDSEQLYPSHTMDQTHESLSENVFDSVIVLLAWLLRFLWALKFLNCHKSGSRTQIALTRCAATVPATGFIFFFFTSSGSAVSSQCWYYRRNIKLGGVRLLLNHSGLDAVL